MQEGNTLYWRYRIVWNVVPYLWKLSSSGAHANNRKSWNIVTNILELFLENLTEEEKSCVYLQQDSVFGMPHKIHCVPYELFDEQISRRAMAIM